MKDRIPTKPNRYAVYDDNHNFLRYEYHERADEPTQAGDALNKANLLPDTAATALGLTGNPQVKDALVALQSLANGKAQIAIGSYTGTGTYGNSNKNSLTFSFIPALLFIYKRYSRSGITQAGFNTDDLAAIIPYAQLAGMADNEIGFRVLATGTHNKPICNFSADKKTIYWHTTSAGAQFNAAPGDYPNEKYYYIAIG